MITVATLHKEHFYRTHAKLDKLSELLLDQLGAALWRIDAWAVFSNHYHVVVGIPPDGAPVSNTLRKLHSDASEFVNQVDSTTGRQVWFQYRDTELTNERSILARTAYVWHNPVRHRIVSTAEQYKWCSAGWSDNPGGRYRPSTIRSFVPTKLNIPDDDFEVVLEARGSQG